MAETSVTSNSNSTSNLPKKEEGEVVITDEPRLKPRRPLKDIISMEILKEYKELILALPKEEHWLGVLRNYNGVWCMEQALPAIFAMQEGFQSRTSDIIVASFIKSGTTWLKALTFTIVHRDKYAISTHPLLKLNPHDCVPFIEHDYAAGDEKNHETLPTPRVLGSQLQYSLLPKSIKTSECPIVYICRDPKDALVSFWHMNTKYHHVKELPSLHQAFELFCEGRVPHGPVWEHVLGYYTESLSRPEKVLILRYEEMLKHPIDNVVKLAKFIGRPFTEEEMKTGVVENIVEFCSLNKLKDLDVNKKEAGNLVNSSFFRKGAVGDWQNYLTPEMANRLDEITKEKLSDSTFTY